MYGIVVNAPERTGNNRTATTARPRVREFLRGEAGSFSIWGLFMFLMLLMIGGIGIDLMLNEMKRTRIQATLDRAVLAAADLDQTLDPTLVVNDYFKKSGLASAIADVTVDQGLNYKTVSATASVTRKTLLIHLLGKPTLVAGASGAAEERFGKVEISMVLDISGSMRWNNKLVNLQAAADEFLDIVLDPANANMVSINVIPYTAHVNAGPQIFDRLNVNKKHDYSYCLEFNDSEFNTTALDTARTYEQGQHFMASSYYSNPISNPGCPKRSYEEITSYSQSKNDLSTKINSFRPRANTSIHLGMKWGVAMLDPSFRPIVDQMVAAGEVDPVFSGRPVDYSDTDTVKTVVLMTDGQNVTTYRIANWAYNSDSEYAHWNRYPLFYYLYNYVPYYYRSNFYYVKYTPSQGDALLDNICDAAKAQGIIVWGVGFETGTHGSNVMRNCASSPSHFFEVQGTEIVDAFTAIARSINKLRLIQ